MQNYSTNYNYINSLQSCCCNTNALNNYTDLMIMNQINQPISLNQSILNSNANNTIYSLNYMNTNYVYPNSCFCGLYNSNHFNTTEKEKENKSLIEELDLIFFPNNPIRDWSEKQIEMINKKYDDVLKQFNLLLHKLRDGN